VTTGYLTLPTSVTTQPLGREGRICSTSARIAPIGVASTTSSASATTLAKSFVASSQPRFYKPRRQHRVVGPHDDAFGDLAMSGRKADRTTEETGPRMESLPSIDGRCNSKYFVWQYHRLLIIVTALFGVQPTSRRFGEKRWQVTALQNHKEEYEDAGNHLASALAALCAVILLNSCAQPRPKAVTSLPKPSPAPAPQPHVARVPEIRGVWVSDTTKLDWDSATANLQRAGFNTIYATSRRWRGVLPEQRGVAEYRAWFA